MFSLEQTLSSQSCWKTTEQALCTIEENASGACVDEVGCACTELADDHAGCQTTGRPSDRTYRWDVVIPEKVVPGGTEPGECYNVDDIIPGECEPDTVIPGALVPVLLEKDGGSGVLYNAQDFVGDAG